MPEDEISKDQYWFRVRSRSEIFQPASRQVPGGPRPQLTHLFNPTLLLHEILDELLILLNLFRRDTSTTQLFEQDLPARIDSIRRETLLRIETHMRDMLERASGLSHRSEQQFQVTQTRWRKEHTGPEMRDLSIFPPFLDFFVGVVFSFLSSLTLALDHAPPNQTYKLLLCRARLTGVFGPIRDLFIEIMSLVLGCKHECDLSRLECFVSEMTGWKDVHLPAKCERMVSLDCTRSHWVVHAPKSPLDGTKSDASATSKTGPRRGCFGKRGPSP